MTRLNLDRGRPIENSSIEPIADPLPTARRVRKARGNSICPSCRAQIRPGQPIALVDGGKWIHVADLIKTITERNNPS
jgi:hypothetical protein